ncbi:MAG: ribosome-binding factor RbfA, partial [Pseudomonadota bacterium]
MKKGRNDSPARGPSQRQFRVGEELRHAMARIIDHAHFRDPDLAGVPITVTEVRVSPDLHNATAFVTPLGGRDLEKVVAALNRAAGYFRREIAREVQLRVVPEIAFAADKSFDYSSRIDALLAQPRVARDLDPDDADADADDAGSDRPPANRPR